MIHVLTRHLAPELDRFRFCPGFWSMLCFDRKLDIFGDVLTHGYNWAILIHNYVLVVLDVLLLRVS